MSNNFSSVNLENNRRGLFELMKPFLKIGDKKLSTYSNENAYNLFKEKYYTSIPGTKELFNTQNFILKKDAIKDINVFFQTFACDLNYAKNSSYCRSGSGTYILGNYTGQYRFSNFTANIFTEGQEPILKLHITSKISMIGLFKPTIKLKTELTADVLDDNNVVIGKMEFLKNQIDEITDFTLTGKIGDDEFNGQLFYKTNVENDDVTVPTTTPTTPTPVRPSPQTTTTQTPPAPPKPKTRYVNKNSFPYKINDRNEIIKKLNDHYNLKQHGDVLTTDLIKTLLKNGMILDVDYDNNQIGQKTIDMLKDKYAGGPLTNEDFLNENILLKKVIKESVRRNLKDIYYGT
jgi:hypothetical protein